MARTLFEAIKANQEAGITPGQQRTREFRQTILAKSGKAAPLATGPQKSSIAEAAGQQQTRAQQAVLGGQEQQQDIALGQQAAGVEQQTQQTMRKLDIADDAQKAKYLRNVSNIAQQLQRDEGQISQQRRNAQIEQAGFMLGLSNKEYVQKLEQTAQTNRLWDQAEFDQQLFQSSLDADYDLYMRDRTFQRLFNASEREFKKELAEMGIGEKVELARRQIEADNARAIATGATTAAAGAADYYQDKPQSPTPTTETGKGGAGTHNYQQTSDYGGIEGSGSTLTPGSSYGGGIVT